jgi:hypothetical protein
MMEKWESNFDKNNNMRALIFAGFKELQKTYSTQPLMLKVILEATTDIEITRTSLATVRSIRYLELIAFHPIKISKEVSLGSSNSFAKYFFNLDLLNSLFFSIKLTSNTQCIMYSLINWIFRVKVVSLRSLYAMRFIMRYPSDILKH